jgi:hypothetical protein
MNIYPIISAIKLVLWVIIVLLTYTSINVYEDPGIGIGLMFLWIFIASRWASFYLFVWIQKLYRHNIDNLKLFKDSYKLSLLFWIYIIINFLLLLGGYRNKFVGILLLAGFIFLQVFLFSETQKTTDEHEHQH